MKQVILYLLNVHGFTPVELCRSQDDQLTHYAKHYKPYHYKPYSSRFGFDNITHAVIAFKTCVSLNHAANSMITIRGAVPKGLRNLLLNIGYN